MLPARADLLALGLPDAVALMRHTTAPGIGVPTNLSLCDCATQRNLSEGSRAGVRAIGEQLNAPDVRFMHILAAE